MASIRHPRSAMLVAAIVILASCGPSSSGTTAEASASGTQSVADPAPAGGSEAVMGPPGAAGSVAAPFPDVVLTDVETGAEVDMAALLPADRPLLLWFWAPH
jgi:hypothetical protein